MQDENHAEEGTVLSCPAYFNWDISQSELAARTGIFRPCWQHFMLSNAIDGRLSTESQTKSAEPSEDVS